MQIAYSSEASNQQTNIKDAMKQISAVTCVTFKQQTDETDYVYFNYGGDGCDSAVGRQGDEQILNLAPGEPGYLDCAETVDVVEHEILHALGFYHEMSRPDRDDYVTIITDNIKDGRCNRLDFRSLMYSNRNRENLFFLYGLRW